MYVKSWLFVSLIRLNCVPYQIELVQLGSAASYIHHIYDKLVEQCVKDLRAYAGIAYYLCYFKIPTEKCEPRFFLSWLLKNTLKNRRKVTWRLKKTCPTCVKKRNSANPQYLCFCPKKKKSMHRLFYFLLAYVTTSSDEWHSL